MRGVSGSPIDNRGACQCPQGLVEVAHLHMKASERPHWKAQGWLELNRSLQLAKARVILPKKVTDATSEVVREER